MEQVYQGHFSNSICSLYVSVSHFGDSLNISNFFIIYYIRDGDLGSVLFEVTPRMP